MTTYGGMGGQQFCAKFAIFALRYNSHVGHIPGIIRQLLFWEWANYAAIPLLHNPSMVDFISAVVEP